MDALSREAKQLYRGIRTEFLFLRFRWNLFRLLYDTDDETIGLLDKAASTFFRVYYHDLLDVIVLAFGRLTDPANDGRNKNASLGQLIASLPKGHTDLEENLKRHRCEIFHYCKGIRRWRNKWTAHRDYKTALALQPRKQLGFNRCDVAKALCHLRQFLRVFEKRFPEPPFHPDRSLSPEELRSQQEEYDSYKVIDSAAEGTYLFPGDGEDLLELLKNAIQPHSSRLGRSHVPYPGGPQVERDGAKSTVSLTRRRGAQRAKSH